MSEHFEFKDGQWIPSKDILGFGEDEELKLAMNRNGFYDFPSHAFGSQHGFRVEVFSHQSPYEPLEGFTHIVLAIFCERFYYYNVSDINSMFDLLHKLTSVAQVEQFTMDADEKEAAEMQKAENKAKLAPFKR